MTFALPIVVTLPIERLSNEPVAFAFALPDMIELPILVVSWEPDTLTGVFKATLTLPIAEVIKFDVGNTFAFACVVVLPKEAVRDIPETTTVPGVLPVDEKAAPENELCPKAMVTLLDR